MRDSIVRTWLAALLLALAPCVAGAAGMGRLNVLSALGHPLSAEIELLSVSKEELSTLNARLAAPDAYRQANLQYNAALPGARVTIEKRPDGQLYLKITSSRPVVEPFIDLLVELTWSSGRLTREYTALLDPPGIAPAPPAPPVSVAPETRPAPEPQPPVTAAVSTPVVAAPSAGAKEYGPIQRGETLGKIAKSVMPEGVTLEQMLVALFRTNPEAFIRKNLNLVRAGKVLRVPDKGEVAPIAQGEAVKEYRTHVADWNAYRQKLADAAGTAPAEGRSAVKGRITTRVEDKAGGGPKDVVRLSKGEPPGAAAGKDKPRGSAAERVRMLEEEVIAREKALKEANERITQLEKTIKDMQKLVELKSAGMAAAQQQAQLAAKPKPEPAKPEAKKPETIAAVKPEPARPVETPKPEAAKAEAPKPEQAAAPEQPKPRPKPIVVAPPPPPPALMDQIMETAGDPLYLAAGGGVIVLGGLAFWMARRRRAMEEADDNPPRAAPIMSTAAAAAAGAAAVTRAHPAAPKTMTETAAPAASTEEVDPLAEAEVYIAYGRDGQAEEILKEALARTPKREDAQLKLLEIYAARKDQAAFGRLAGDLQKQTGGVGDNWLKAAAMGYALDPGNVLYIAGKGAPSAAPLPAAGPISGSGLDFDLGIGAGAGITRTDFPLDSGATQVATQTVLDTGMAAAARKAEEAPSGPFMPDFTLDVPSAAEGSGTSVAFDVGAPSREPRVIDFQIELPKTAAPADDQPTTVLSRAPAGGLDFKMDIPDVTLNLGGAPKTVVAGVGAEKDGQWYGVQTKFDLARAYQEMGDKAGAKEILQEVMNEGNAEQKAQAKALLDNLG